MGSLRFLFLVYAFICGNERVNDLNSHGKADLQPSCSGGVGQSTLKGLQGFPWRAKVSEHLQDMAVS